jgi:hypothetical protein
LVLSAGVGAFSHFCSVVEADRERKQINSREPSSERGTYR